MAKILYPYPESLTLTRAREIHTAKMCDALARCGNEVTWLIGKSGKIDERKIKNHFGLTEGSNLKIVFAPRSIKFASLKISLKNIFLKRMDQLVRKNGFDIIYCIHLKAADYILDAHYDTKLLFEAHEIFSDAYPRNHRKSLNLHRLEKRIYPHVDLLITTSNYLHEEVKSRFGSPKNQLTAYNAVDRFEKVIPQNTSTNGTIGIYVGSFISWKGVDILLKAWSSFNDKTLILCGGSQNEIITYQKMTQNLGISDHVIFLGHRNSNEIKYWLSKAQVAIAPNTTNPKSSLYSFPMKLLEYCAAGKTVVASSIPVVSEISNHFQNLFLFKPGDIKGLSNKINEAFKSESPTSLNNPPENYSWDYRALLISERISQMIKRTS